VLTEHPRVDELIPAMATKLVNPAAAAQIREMVRQTTSDRQSSSGRISLTDGRHFEFAAVPLPDGNALFTMVDVTDSTRIQAALRERAEALEAADQVKTDFVANMSYELRTPLTSIGGFAEMLAGGYAGKLSSSASDYVDAILEAVSRLSKLIDDVLDLTQGDIGGIVLERERVDIAGLCRMALEGAQLRAGEKNQRSKLTSPIAPASPLLTPAGFGNPSSMFSIMRSPIPTSAAAFSLKPAVTKLSPRSGSATMASESPRTTCLACSTASTGSTRPECAARPLSVWGCR